jgi:cystathionine gamma-synthase
MSTIPDSAKQQTLAARYAVDSDDSHGAVIPPLYMSSNFSFHGFGEKREYDYTRSGNPNRDQLAGALAALEGGAGGVITASGMSAVHLVTQLVKPGELIVAPHDCYGGEDPRTSAAYRLDRNPQQSLAPYHGYRGSRPGRTSS